METIKEIIIHAKLSNDKIATLINHKGYPEEDTINQIFDTIGVLENVKSQMLHKLENKGIKNG